MDKSITETTNYYMIIVRFSFSRKYQITIAKKIKKKKSAKTNFVSLGGIKATKVMLLFFYTLYHCNEYSE